MYNGIKIIDAHTHNAQQFDPEYFAAFLARTGTDAACVNTVAHSRCISLTPQALALKELFPGRFYVFGGLDMSEKAWSMSNTCPPSAMKRPAKSTIPCA